MKRVQFVALAFSISALGACGSSGSSTGNNNGGSGAAGGSTGNTGGSGNSTSSGGSGNSTSSGGGGAANATGGAGGASTAGAGGNSTAGGNGNVGGMTGAGGAACQANVSCDAFPTTFIKGCTTSDNCIGSVHQIDCCGARRVLGMNHSEATTFCAAETTCRDAYPNSTCTSDLIITDSGTAPAMDNVAAKCDNGTCTTFVCGTSSTAACPATRHIGTCG